MSKAKTIKSGDEEYIPGQYYVGIVELSNNTGSTCRRYHINRGNICISRRRTVRNYLTDTKISLRLLSSKDKDTLFFELSKINKVITVNLILKNVLTKFIL